MRDVQVDIDGQKRCWNCGAKSFTPISHFSDGARHLAASLLDRPNLGCTRCGADNKVGDAKLYAGPEDPRYLDEWTAEHVDGPRPLIGAVDPAAPPPAGRRTGRTLLLGAIVTHGPNG